MEYFRRPSGAALSRRAYRDFEDRRLETVIYSMPSRPNAMRVGPLPSSEDVLLVFRQIAFPTGTGHGRDLFLVVNRLGVADIDEVVLGKSGMQRDIHIAMDCARPGQMRRRKVGDGSSGDRPEIEHSLADDPQPARAFACTRHGAVGKKAARRTDTPEPW